MASLVSDGGALVRTLYGSSIPVVAACTGHALAAGALVLLGCDVRVGADVDCKIGLNEVAIGMVLPDWAFTIAVDRLSKRHLQRAVATARITSAAGAVDAGYLDEVVPADDRCSTSPSSGPPSSPCSTCGLRRHRATPARRGARPDGRADRSRPVKRGGSPTV